jgi:hypothetical protein
LISVQIPVDINEGSPVAVVNVGAYSNPGLEWVGKRPQTYLFSGEILNHFFDAVAIED